MRDGAKEVTLAQATSRTIAVYRPRGSPEMNEDDSVMTIRAPRVPTVRTLECVVPVMGSHGAHPIWRVGAVLRHCLGMSQPERARAWRFGAVTVNGEPAEFPHRHCRPGDVVVASYPERESSVVPDETVPLHVLFEDDYVLAVSKPAGVLAHPARGEQSGTVANAVARRYDDGSGRVEAVRPVHRLDRDTSGVLIFARDAATARRLARGHGLAGLDRDYLAVAHGHPPVRGTIDCLTGPDLDHPVRQRVVTIDEASSAPRFRANGEPIPLVGARAVTSFRVLAYGRGAALVAARLHTGRTHQVRLHLASLGHPLVGDQLYGGGVLEIDGENAWNHRHALHAWRVRFLHPAHGGMVEVVASLPHGFASLVRSVVR
jgi:23S rRNA pseudouridine1911/1915/1917 synthase